MLSSIKQRIDRDDEGFTLIELMVVLLIIAILLAIAIPTFLGARNTANARSTQENLRNALTAEQTYWTSNQNFSSSLSTIESALTWDTVAPTKGGADVLAMPYSDSTGTWTADTAGTGTADDGVELLGYGKDGNCYLIFASNNSTSSYTAYGEDTGACPGPSATIAPPTAKPTAANAANGATSSGGNWSLAF